MNENMDLQQELNFRLSLLRLVTNAPFRMDEPTSTKESVQIESMYAMVASGPASR